MVRASSQRLLLIQPPFYRLFNDAFSLDKCPLGLMYLAGAVLEHTSWDVAVYNADFQPAGKSPRKVGYMAGPGFQNYLANLNDPSHRVWKEIHDQIVLHRPDVVGITATSPTFAPAQVIARLARQVNPEATLLIGGPHASMAGGRVLEQSQFDIAVRGEGELTIVELLQALEAGRSLEGIDGIVYRGRGGVVENPPRRYLADLDSLCMPHEVAPRVLVDYEKHPLTSFRSLFATRGCPFHCLFCGSREVWGRKARLRSPANVVREIQGLQKLGLSRFQFEDDTFGTSRRHIHDLCFALRRHCPGIKWNCEIHASLVDAETVAQMKSAGCYSIAVGIESGSNEILRQMRKSTTIERSLAACKVIRDAGVELMTFFLVGYPQETEASLASTVRAMKATRADELVYSIFTPYPYTEAWELCRKEGLVDEQFDVALYNHQSPANHFCQSISPKRFRVLARRIERMVDRHNAWGKWARKCKRLARQLGWKPDLALLPAAPEPQGLPLYAQCEIGGHVTGY